jgi:hypothetical protein
MVAFLETDEAKTPTMHQRNTTFGYQHKTRIHK